MNDLVVHVVYACRPGAFAGGVSKMVFELSSAQARLGPVEIWTVADQEQQTVSLDGQVTIRSFIGRRVGGVVSSRALARGIKARSSDIRVIHAHNTFHPLNLQVGRAAGKTRLPIFYSSHGALDPVLLKGGGLKVAKKRWYIRLFESPNLNRGSGVFALTELEREQLRRSGITAPIYVVPNGVPIFGADVGADGGLPGTMERLNHAGQRILYIGRIVEKKGIHYILRAFKLIRSEFPKSTFVIAGNHNQFPDYTRYLMRLSKELGIADAVHWAGFVDEHGKPTLLSSAAVFVHASTSEGMPMAILEAMSHGVPVVASKGCYMSMAASAGAITECEQSPESIAAALCQMLSHPQENLVVNARNYLCRHHRWSEIAKTTFEIYGSS